MSAPLRHRTLAELVGSWPFAPVPSLSAPQLVPSSIEPRATILGVRRDVVGGWAVGGKNFYLWRSVAGVPTQVQIVFSPGNKTLAQVISAINGTVGISPDVMATNDNGFLRITDPALGENSYLRLESIAGSEDVFFGLGLFAETLARGGDPTQAQHGDPTRAVASPGQLAFGVGDPFDAQSLNRMAYALSANIDRAVGLLDERSVAVKVRETFAGSGATNVRLNTSNLTEGVFLGLVATPTTAQLLDVLVVLDANGNEFTREYQEVLNGGLTDLTFTIDATSGETRCASASAPFSSTDVVNNVHVLVTNFAVAVALNNVPLKIIRYVSTSLVVVMPLTPSTGAPVSIIEANRSGSRIKLHNVRAEIDGLYTDAGLTTRAEQVSVAVADGTGPVTGIQLNNRVVSDDPAVDFTTATLPGNLVVWSGASSTDPWTNNGTYRVRRVLDAQTLELCGADYGPIYLNPNASLGFGSIAVQTDGEFYPAPYARFAQPSGGNLSAGRGAVPQTGDTFQVVYMVGRSARAALEANPAAFAVTPRFDQEAAASVKRALMQLAGPSVTSFDELLHGDYDLSLEKLDYRMDKEHYESNGRHSTIRPDVVDMYPDVSGTTVRVRTSAADDAGAVVNKVEFVDSVGNVRWLVTQKGRMVMNGAAPVSYTTYGTPAIDLQGGNGIASVIRLGGALPTFLASTNTSIAGAGAALSGSAKYAWRWDNGVDHRTDYLMSLAREIGYNAVKMSVLDDGTGASVVNQQVWHSSGAVGFNLGVSDPNDAGPGVPVTNVHVRARNTGDVELLRLEGFDGTHETVALSFKPRLDQPIFSFIENDLDSGDWFMNFVLTEDMTVASSAVTAFRFIVEAAGIGAGKEVARMGNLVDGLVDVGTSFNANNAEAVLPRYAAALLATRPNQPVRFRGAGTAIPGYGVSVVGAGLASHLIGAYLDENSEYNYDIAGAGGTFWALRELFDTGGHRWALQYAPSNVVTAPFAEGAWTNAMRHSISSGPTNAGLLEILNGALQFVTVGSGSNLASSSIPLPNAIYAKSMKKVWAVFTMTGDGANITFTNTDGFGGLGLAWANGSPTRIQLFWGNNFTAPGTTVGVAISVMSGGTRSDTGVRLKFVAGTPAADHVDITAESGDPPAAVANLALVTATRLVVEVYGTQAS